MNAQKKNIIILGAGTMQLPAIASAKELGCFVIALDADQNAAGTSRADRFERIDIKDAAAVRDYALRVQKTEGLCGVFTAGTDFSFSVSLAAEACGLAAHASQAAKNASDKALMRACFARGGVASPRFFEASAGSLDTRGLDFPLVVKPVDNMGARGCRMARSKDEFAAALTAARENSRSGRVIVEEYMDGPEFSVDALVYDGTLTVCGFADRHIFFPPYFIELGHTMPTEFAPETVRALIAEFARGVHALGLTRGAAKGDIKLTARGPMIGEIAARLSGGYMSGWTFPYASGLNLTKEALKIALGQKPDALEAARRPLSASEFGDGNFALYDVPCTQTCAERAWISIPGIVQSADISNADGCVKDVFVRAREGDAVTFPRNNVQKCGNAVALAPARQQAIESTLAVTQNAVLRLKAPNERTEEFLFGAASAANAPDESDFPPDAFVLDDAARSVLNTALASCPPIPRGKSVFAFLPAPLAPLLDSIADWNHRTLRQSIAAFDSLCSNHAELPAREFWLAAVRGGLQGMLYVADKQAGQC